MSGTADYLLDDSPARTELFEGHVELVSRIAHHLVMRLPPGQQMEDYIQVGLIGLWEASKRYQPAEAASFKTFAGIYIRGAILDELRRQSWTPRSTQSKSKRIAAAIRGAEAKFGRTASSAEIAEEMGESLDNYNDMLAETAGAWLVPLDNLEPEGGNMAAPTSSPAVEAEEDALRDNVAEIIKGLPQREQLVVSLYYQDELNLREIGEVLGVGESRVCQIHSQAVGRIKSRMSEGWLEDDGADESI
ncbi:MAG: RNA polymerase sigma factor FliA [Halieaceae bacterium]